MTGARRIFVAVLSQERGIALGAVVLLTLFRSLPFALYEQIQFDSDQAVFGLMAKHLSERRAFPLFMYGNAYLLAVEAWLAAPWFLVAPANLLTLSLSLILTNIATAVVIVLGLERFGGLRPFHALVASLFFVLAPPVVAGDLVSVSGGNVEPFLYIAILWFLRERPLWSGIVLALGFLHREFTVYAVPALLGADVLSRRRVPYEIVRKWLLMAVVCLGTWQGVQALQPYADLMGPGTRGQLLGGFAGSQVGNLLARVDLDAATAPSRIDGMARIHLPRLLAVLVYEDGRGRMRAWLAWIAAGATLALVARLGLVVWRAGRAGVLPHLQRAAFGWYLLIAGVLAAVAYAASRPVIEEHSRYGLLVLLVPAGLVAVLLALERGPHVRTAVTAGVLAWASISAADSLRLYARYADRGPADLRVLAETLAARDVRAAYAPYWTAYAVTFMTGERVKVASTDVVRIAEYQALAASAPDVIHIRDEQCAGGERVARWYLCR